jgi:hypothetical protein
VNKQQRQARSNWATIPPELRDPSKIGLLWIFTIDRDPGDEHDPDGAIEHAEAMARYHARYGKARP